MDRNLVEAAKNVRKNIIKRVHSQGTNGAHVGPALSLVEILTYLFLREISLKREDFKKDKRDRFILSKGHGALAYYCVLYEAGIITKDELESFETNGGPFPGQPSKNPDYAMEYSSGSLGLGLSYAAGLALGVNSKQNKIYVVLGDGELNEGSIWESAMFTGFHNLKNIVAIVDKNSMQSDGKCSDILTFDIKKMFEACNFEPVECEGHNFVSIERAFKKETKKPKVIIANTVKGKGVSFIENSREWHHNRITDEQLELALSEIESGVCFGN